MSSQFNWKKYKSTQYIMSSILRGVNTTEQKWHGSDKNWNGSNSFCKETVKFYPFRVGSTGAYGPVTERIKLHCFFAKNYWNRSSFYRIRAIFALSCKSPFETAFGVEKAHGYNLLPSVLARPRVSRPY